MKIKYISGTFLSIVSNYKEKNLMTMTSYLANYGNQVDNLEQK